jgi:hypothetical protein
VFIVYGRTLAKYLRIKEQYQKAYHFAKAAVEIPLPNDLLFIHKGVYTWIASDELSISAYWTGRYEGCANLCEALLVNPKLFSEEVHQRISANLDFALEKLDQQKVG